MGVGAFVGVGVLVADGLTVGVGEEFGLPVGVRVIVIELFEVLVGVVVMPGVSDGVCSRVGSAVGVGVVLLDPLEGSKSLTKRSNTTSAKSPTPAVMSIFLFLRSESNLLPELGGGVGFSGSCGADVVGSTIC